MPPSEEDQPTARPRSRRSPTPTSGRTSRPPTPTTSSRPRSRRRSRCATRATRRSTRSSCGRARTSTTARTSSPTRRRSTSRRRSTRGCSIENLRETAATPARTSPSCTLFETFDGLDELDLVEFYQHDANWSNRMILGDSLHVMASASPSARALRGKVQMIYIDPPVRDQVRLQLAGLGPQARRQGRQARGRHPRGRADQGVPRHLGARDPLLPHLPARPAAWSRGTC